MKLDRQTPIDLWEGCQEQGPPGGPKTKGQKWMTERKASDSQKQCRAWKSGEDAFPNDVSVASVVELPVTGQEKLR